ncbi:MAG: hypothetical protein KDD94_10950, partial [Calditrichaeota bacterium]|nr:hypothetical protein [Calditrichota bacterium]
MLFLVAITLLLGNPSFKTDNPQFIYLELSGTAYQRGYRHGSELKDKIYELVDKWKKSIEYVYKVPADDFVRNFVKTTDFISDIRKETPDLLEEVKGIADGCGLDFETIYAFQLVDEMWFNGEQVMADKCTCLSVKKNGMYPTLASQNLDIPKFYHGYQTVLKIKE